jgi:branched-chain amino acid transport system substrate-binding protein
MPASRFLRRAFFASTLALAVIAGCDQSGSTPTKTSSTPATTPTTTGNAGTPSNGNLADNTPPAPGESTPAGTTPSEADAPRGDGILVGHFASMTGKEATFGQSTDNGIRLALKEINDKGGLNGKKLDVITYDDKGDSKEAGTAVTRLITSDHVAAVLGEVASSLSLAGGQVCEQYGVPMISPSSTNPRVTQGKEMVFRVCFIDPFQAAAISQFITDNLKLTKAAILFDQTQAYSKGLRDDFTKAFTAGGGTVVADQAYSGGDADFSAQLTTIKAANPEIIFVPGYYTEGGNIAIQARKLGINVPLIGGDGWDSSQLGAIGGAAIEGCYYSNHSAPDQPNMTEFVSKYKAEYGATPDALGGLGYDAMMVLFDAMKRAPSLEGKALAKAIAETKDFHGVTGNITIDKDHNAQKGVVIVQMKGGSPVFAAAVDPSAKK